MHAPIVKRSLAAAVLVILALGMSACSGRTSWVAKVNGATVSGNHFAEGISLYTRLQSSGGAAPTSPTTTLPGAVPTTQATSYAMLLVQSKLVDSLNKKHGVVVTDATRQAVRTSLTGAQGIKGFTKFPGWFQSQLVNMQAGYEALTSYFGKSADQNTAAKQYYDANIAQFKTYCISVIVSKSSDKAAATRAQITSPASFAAVAKQVATADEPAEGAKKDGDVGCIPVSNLSQSLLPADLKTFEAAPDSSLLGPYSMAGGVFIVILKSSEKVASFSEVKATILQQLGAPGEAQANRALSDAVKSARITLNPSLGTWKRGVGPTPPAGAQLSPGVTTTTVAAATRSSASG